jgi:hypothetical protein
MTAQSFMSQAPYIVAPVLIVSGLVKIVDRFRGSTKLIVFISAIFELALGILLVVMSSREGIMRNALFVLTALLFLAFTLRCFEKKFRGNNEPCMCFGTSSIKGARTFACIRNLLLVVISLSAIFGDARGPSPWGIVMAIVVLGVIYFEEIN